MKAKHEKIMKALHLAKEQGRIGRSRYFSIQGVEPVCPIAHALHAAGVNGIEFEATIEDSSDAFFQMFMDAWGIPKGKNHELALDDVRHDILECMDNIDWTPTGATAALKSRASLDVRIDRALCIFATMFNELDEGIFGAEAKYHEPVSPLKDRS